MSLPIVLSGLHLLPGWTRQATPDITPNPPQTYGYYQKIPGEGMFLYCQGQAGKYCGWLTALVLPLPAGIPPQFTMSGDLVFRVDSQTPQNAQAIEFDIIAAISQYNYLGGTQMLPQQGNAFQIADVNGGWQPAFPGPTTFAADVEHHLTICNVVNTANQTYTRPNLVLDNGIYVPPTAEQNLNGNKLEWDDCLIVQIQQGTKNDGSGWTMIVDDCSLTISA
jgi:hypothetical protein